MILSFMLPLFDSGSEDTDRKCGGFTVCDQPERQKCFMALGRFHLDSEQPKTGLMSLHTPYNTRHKCLANMSCQCM